MVNVLATAQSLCNTLTAMGNWIGVATGVPGSTSTVLNEATGGSPAYARQATTWATASVGGSSVGSDVTLNLPPGTYPYMIICSGSSGNNMVNWIPLNTPIVASAQGAFTITPTTSVT